MRLAIAIAVLFSALSICLQVGYRWENITILGLAVLLAAILFLIGWLANRPKPYKDPPMNITANTDKEWNEYVKQYPQAWQYCKTCGERIVHVFNKVTRRWECLGCKTRSAP
jgi:hypothetical protein